MSNGNFIDVAASDGSSAGKDNNEQCTDKGFPSQCIEKITSVVDEKHTESPSLEKKGISDCLLTSQKQIITHNEIAVSGVKRSRETNDEQQPMVHVNFNSLPRKSKKKLDELLHHWSEWHARECSNSEDSNELLESGEETFYPALHVGSDKSLVSFSLDTQVRKKQCRNIVQLNGESTSLYNREYEVALTSVDGESNHDSGLKILDVSRCFNCESYNHSMKDCSKPRDTVAVQKARKKHKDKKSHSAGPRIITRYYQNSPGGKYAGLKPGVLADETRKALGLEDLDPPPWMFRMRDLGYPPGYEEEDQPSGIKIFPFDEEEPVEKTPKSDGKKPIKKMTVDFPGVNALIPENADRSKWNPANSNLNSSSTQSYNRSNSYSDFNNNNNNNNTGPIPDQLWSSRLPVTPPSISGYLPNYNGFVPNYQNGTFSPTNLSFSAYFPDGRRQSPFGHETSPSYGPYNSLPYLPPY